MDGGQGPQLSGCAAMGPEKGAEAHHLPPPHHRASEWRLAVGASDENDSWQVRRKRMVDIFHEGGWEYRCEPLALPDPAAAERTLNQLGKAGWELVEVVRGDGERDNTRVAVLKRKLFWS